MKIPSLKAGFTLLGLAFACQAMAVLPASNEPLPNFDKRRSAPAPALAVPDPTKANAASLLVSRVPGLAIATDPFLGTPRMVSAREKLLTGPHGVGGAVSEPFLQAVPVDDPHRVIKAFLNEHAALFGHDASALDSARVSRDYVSKHNGLRTVVWEQTQDGIPVYEGLLVGHITKNGELVNVADHFVANPQNAASTGTPHRAALLAAPAITSARAIARAAANIGSSVDEAAVGQVQLPQGPERRQSLRSDGLLGPAYAQLVWFPLSQSNLRLCWQVVFNGRPVPNRYLSLVDAETGEVVLRHSLTEHISPASYNVYTSDSPSPLSPGYPVPSTNQPPYTNRVVVTFPALDTNASPAGWINDGDNTTTGNNADAFLDRNLDLSPDVPRPQGFSTNRVFNFPLDLNSDPLTYAAASTVQLFYRANWYHDRLYELGFTEAAGNYQTTNFDRGGLGNDAVICLVQAGADVGDTDNSMFQPAPDGTPGYCYMFVFDQTTPFRDGSLDQEVVCHEMTHGVSNRLLGHGTLISELQSEGMGEGWSDFYALALLSESGDDVNGNYAMGGYVTANFFGEQDNYYYGIRRYPYTTDMTKNPLTFKDIDPTQADPHIGVPVNSILGGSPADEVHNQGEVWCVTLHEMWASLVTKYGWAVGNELSLQLVTDGLSLAPANATFLEARDGILQADVVDTGGSDIVEIWTAFAKRGMGYSAIAPDSTTTIGVFESFDLPPDIATGPPDGILEVTVSPTPGTVLFAGDTNSFFIHVRDTSIVTNATITASINGTNLTFHDDGAAPDFAPLDGTYSATFVVPSGQSSFTIPITVTAPGKTNATLSVTYFTIPPPPNDFFANSIKVPSAGAKYDTSNARATMETGEPQHARVATAAASLWWTYAPPAAGQVLVDSGGSDVSTVVAVYTGNNVSNLQQVASARGATGTTGRKGAYVLFQAQAGVPYRIAVASINSNNVGGLRVNIGLNLLPDLSPPTVTITSPQNGTPAASIRLQVSGSAVDSEPNASGIKQINLSVTPNSVIGEPITNIAYLQSSLDGPLSSNWTAIVGLHPGIDTITARAQDFAGNLSAPFSIEVSYRPLDPPNDFFVDATMLTDSSGVLSDNTLNATKEIGEPNHAGVAGGKSAWWVFTAPADGVLHLSTTNSTFDTVLAVYTGSSLTNLAAVGSNDDAYPGAPGGYSEIYQPVHSNITYHVAVDGFGGVGGAMFLTYSFTPGQLFLVSISTNGVGVVSPSSPYVQSNGVVTLSAIPGANYSFDSWSGAVSSLANPLSVTVNGNMSLTANFVPTPPSDGFESGAFSALNWRSAGNAPWIIQSNIVNSGVFAARSGAISNNQYSSLVLTTNFGPGMGSFSYRVSSEANWATLSFYLDGVQLQQWSGNVPWANYAFPLSTGSHTLEWRYAKSIANVVGLDAAFLDNVNLPIQLPFNAATKPNLVFSRMSDGSTGLTMFGQTNQVYTIQVSTDLKRWQDVTTATAFNGYLRISDANGFTNGTSFYRAVAP
ncbi:MAG TPA: M36 family metallopeptidase [Verrucomicrobiae bacterium]|nr:M36 family metallopeptidase [Verrucomicrobiae bacterium]